MSTTNSHPASHLSPSRHPHRLAPTVMLLRRLLAALGLRQQRLPSNFSERMYRDIGILPPPKPPAGPWPWYDPRA